jgi:hypothetical protein
LYDLEQLDIDFSRCDQTKLKAWSEFTEACHWVFPFKNLCILVDSPRRVQLQDGVIHSEDGMAVEYSDGWGIYALEGVRLPGKVVMEPDKLTLDEIEAEGNAEVRRIMIDRFGPSRYMRETDAKCLDYSAGLGLVGSAPRALYQTKKGEKWLVGSDGSTKRVYWIPVPAEAETCAQAHCLIAGFDSESRLIAEA